MAPARRPDAPDRSAPRARTRGTSDDFFRHMVANMRNGVLAINRDGALVLINDEAYRTFGLPDDLDYLGQPFSDVFRSHPDIVRVLSGAFELASLPNRAELRLKSTAKVIGYTLSLIRDERDAIIGAALFFKDLTHVEQMEERERLRDRLATLGEMAATMAHEIKNPLAGIEVMAGLLRRKIPDAPDAQMVLTDIISEAKMANAIVQEVLDFVRPIRLQVDHTAVTDAVQGAIQLADSKGKRGNVDVNVAISEGLPHINADQHQITQVFTNLLMNAYEAMGGKGQVAISAEMIRIEDGSDGREAVLVEFADNGPGIPPDVAEKVFDPFFTTKAQGSGLGLAIVRKIVDAHDGRIDLRTTPGQGTTIRVTLPVTGGNEE